jgi:uncharacterized phage protein (TIGR01671 family)
MREYKFKGKRIDNGEWVYGYYSVVIEHGDNGGVEHLYRETATALHYISNEEGISHIVIPETVGEITGLRDCKRTAEYPEGQEVYEGDIIRFTVFDYNGSDTQHTGVIKWSGARFAIWHDNEQEYYGSDGAFDLDWVFAQDDEMEVIGNIHSNPELLGGT